MYIWCKVNCVIIYSLGKHTHAHLWLPTESIKCWPTKLAKNGPNYLTIMCTKNRQNYFIY